MKNVVTLCLFVLTLQFNFICCSGGNLLNGTWENNEKSEFNSIKDYVSIVEFSGKNFTITEYFHEYWFVSPYYYVQHDVRYSYIDKNIYSNSFSFNKDNIDLKNIDVNRFTIIESNDPEYILFNIKHFPEEVIVNYKGDEKDNIYKYVTKGTYSISEDKIEMIFENGLIAVYPFSRTENTITIDDIQLKRKM